MAMSMHLPAGYATLAYNFVGTGLPLGAATTFQVQLSTPDDTPVEVGTTFNALWNTHLKSLISSSVTMTGTRVKFGPMEDGPFTTVSASLAGTSSASTVPPNTAVLITKRTAFGGKSGSGRMFHPGANDTIVDDSGKLTPATQTAWQTAFSAWYVAAASSGSQIVLAHTSGTYTKKDGTVVTVADRLPSLVLGLNVASQVATQRRRNRR